jgi:hypothetical protein
MSLVALTFPNMQQISEKVRSIASQQWIHPMIFHDKPRRQNRVIVCDTFTYFVNEGWTFGDVLCLALALLCIFDALDKVI